MSDDGIECKVRYWVNVPRITHRMVLLGKEIGTVWSDGTMVLDDDPDKHPGDCTCGGCACSMCGSNAMTCDGQCSAQYTDEPAHQELQ